MARSVSTPAVPVTRERTPGQGASMRREGRTTGWRADLAGLGFVLPFLIAYGLFLVWPVIQGFRMSLFN